MKYFPRVCTVKYFPLRVGITENHLFQHHPTFEGNKEINHNDSLKLYTVAFMTHLGYTVKYIPLPPEIPSALRETAPATLSLVTIVL